MRGAGKSGARERGRRKQAREEEDNGIAPAERLRLADAIAAHRVSAGSEHRRETHVGAALGGVVTKRRPSVLALVGGSVAGKHQLVPDQLRALGQGVAVRDDRQEHLTRILLMPEVGRERPHVLKAGRDPFAVPSRHGVCGLG
eukprot:878722-Rhodomonas_salina.2